MAMSVQQAYFGCDEPLPHRLQLRAGSVSLELVGGRFGPVLVNGHEIWHGLAFLFRDTGWGTPEPVYKVVTHQITADGHGFTLELSGHIAIESRDICDSSIESALILLNVTVTGEADGCLHFQARAEPTHDVLTNRCGWVLLHPMSMAGRAVEVLHGDGRTSLSTFPKEVPAWPPFMRVNGLRHEYAPGYWAEARMSDEDYETEDQRNNADASFKTYSRSNNMPRPYVLRQKEPWTRELTLCVLNDVPKAIYSERDHTAVNWMPTSSVRVNLGLAITVDTVQTPSQWLCDVLNAWRPAFLHLTLWPEIPIESVDWAGVRTLLDAAQAVLRIDICAPRELGHGSFQGSLCRQLKNLLTQAGIEPAEVAALPCGSRAAVFLRELFPKASIGGGTPHFFAQLNRLENSGGEDFMSFTVCPTVHGTEEESLMTGLQSLPSMLATARIRHPHRRWHIGPSALSARASPLGKQPLSDGLRKIPLASCDPRSRGLFGAAWLLGHLAAAVAAKVASVTFPSLCTEDGLFVKSNDQWHMTPSAAMLQICMAWIQVHTAFVEDDTQGCSNLSKLAMVTGETVTGRQVLVANLTSKVQKFHWPYGGQLKCLNASSWINYRESLSNSPWGVPTACPKDLTLSPYDLYLIDLPIDWS